MCGLLEEACAEGVGTVRRVASKRGTDLRSLANSCIAPGYSRWSSETRHEFVQGRPERIPDRIGEDTAYGEDYVIKIAYEYLKTRSRSQRFNYKRRLKDLAMKQPDLEVLIDEVLERYMGH